uniref:HAT C-terminal dimerisation domain-containing protein n=1 Tax=Nothobranchius korthausae TaxID=1143690 RepID=A0A1A8FVL7_9TELE
MEPSITVTAHYITDSWQLKARVLCTAVMPERHTAVNIADRLSRIISEWGLQRLFQQRIAVQSVLADEAVTKSSVQKSLAMRASQWERVEQLIPVLHPLAKAAEIMCGELHVGLSFIHPVIFNMISSTRCVEESDLAAVRTFKNTVRQQLETRFKLSSEDLTESIPIVACMLDPRFKHLQFIPQNKREAAQRHLDVLLQNREPPAATAEEIRDYFSTPHIPTMDNPLQWWSRNQDRFPCLAKLSKSYLAVPATSTPSERIFHLLGIRSPDRGRAFIPIMWMHEFSCT